jgi:hypothetical protein
LLKVVNRSGFIPYASKRSLGSGELIWQFFNLATQMVSNRPTIQPEVDPALAMGKNVMLIAERTQVGALSNS